jgi:predicted ATPase
VTISGLQGQGGIGKTALALVLANKLAKDYADAQIDLDLRGTSPTPLAPADVMAHVIWAFQPTTKLPDEDAQLAALYRSVLQGKRVLLLLDNARDAAQVEPLLPPAGCLLLVTSRADK